MPTFTPPTYTQGFLPERKDDWSLMRWYDFQVGRSVLITGGVASVYPGVVSPSQDDINAADAGSGMGGKAAFIGGRTYTVTAGEQTILEAAGYTVDP